MALWTGWKSKPPQGTPLDPTNTSNVGLQLCLTFNEGSGPPIDVQYSSLATEVTGLPTWTNSIYGPALTVSGSNYIASPFRGNGWNNSPWSIRIIHNPNWISSFTTLVDGGVSSSQRDMSFFFDTSGNLDFYGVGGQGAGATASIATAMSSGSWWDLVIAGDGLSSGIINFYVNGVNKGSLTSVNQTGTAFQPLNFGFNSSSGGTSYTGQYALIQYWTRTLAAPEIASLHTNPWHIFQTPPFCSLLKSSGATSNLGSGVVTFGGFSVAGTGASRSIAAGSPTLGVVATVGAGTSEIAALGAISLAGLTSAGTGTSRAIAAGGITLEGFAVAGMGSSRSIASGEVTLSEFTAAGTGFTGANGAGAITLTGMIAVGAGTEISLATGGVQLVGLSPVGVGLTTVLGSGSPTLGSIQAAGSATSATLGAGSITLAGMGAAGEGSQSNMATGSIIFGSAVVAGAGFSGAATMGFLSPQVTGAGRTGGPLFRPAQSSAIVTTVDPRKAIVAPGGSGDTEIVHGAQNGWNIQATNRDGTLPATGDFLSTDTLTATVWVGRNRAAIFAPTVTWANGGAGASTCLTTLAVTAAQSSQLTPSEEHQAQIFATRAEGDPVCIAWITLTCLPAAGSGTALTTTYAEYSDLEFYAPWLQEVIDVMTDAGDFYPYRLRTRHWIDRIIVKQARPSSYQYRIYAQVIPWGPVEAPNFIMEGYLAADYLMVDDVLVEICARKALSLIAEKMVSGQKDDPWPARARYQRRMADNILSTYRPQISISSAPSVVVSDQLGGGAQALALIANGGVIKVVPRIFGNGYSNSPNIGLSGGTGTGATAVGNVVDGAITSYTVTNPGQGYFQKLTADLAFNMGVVSIR
jgi:hypothetical protein